MTINGKKNGSKKKKKRVLNSRNTKKESRSGWLLVGTARLTDQLDTRYMLLFRPPPSWLPTPVLQSLAQLGSRCRYLPGVKRGRLQHQHFYTTRSQATQTLDSSPIEFLSNLTPPVLKSKIKRAISCTSDLSSSTNTNTNTTSSSSTSSSSTALETNHIPFKVTAKEPSSTVTSTEQKSLSRIVRPYVQLSKPRLTALVVLSAICSYALTPFNATVPQLIFLTVGTALCSASANAINMGREPEFDRLMVRTVARPVVRGILTPQQAFQFAAGAGVVGTAVLLFGVNSTVALLGAANIVLYGWTYTSLKRVSILNTWVGAVVGAIPPLMGWAASSPLSDPGAWCLAGLLYAWQFPHFNALSHNLRNEYRNAGYVMTSFVDPRLNARVGLRYSLLMFPLCIGLALCGVTDWVFPLDSGLLNGWLSYWAFRFWWQQHKNYKSGKLPDPQGMKLAGIYAKRLFWGSVLHLPGVLVLAMLHKKGRWDWLFDRGNKLAFTA